MTNTNKLIAEFMGWKLFASGNSKPHQEMAMHEPVYNEAYKGLYFDVNQADYDWSWDWLMPVVEKIESLSNEICNEYFWNTDDAKKHNDFRINWYILHSQVA